MRYLIIGGTSIFGEGLIDSLLSKDSTEKIIATKLASEKSIDRENLEWKDLDLRNAEETNMILEEAAADIIFDLAAQDSVGYSWKKPVDTVDVNVVGTINLLNALRDKSPNSRLVIGGSGEEYGMLPFSELPVREDTITHPNNIYGATKASQTMFAKLYHDAFNLDIVILRVFYGISTKQGEKFAVSSFCKQFAEIEAGLKEPVIYVGNINNLRDFTDIDDIVEAYLSVAENGKSGEIYNAARGDKTSLLDVIYMLEELTDITVEIHAETERVRPMDSPAMIADTSRIKKDTGWEARTPIQETIEKMLDYWRQNI